MARVRIKREGREDEVVPITSDIVTLGRASEALPDLRALVAVLPASGPLQLEHALAAETDEEAAAALAAGFLFDPAGTLDRVGVGGGSTGDPEAAALGRHCEAAATWLADATRVAALLGRVSSGRRDPAGPGSMTTDERRVRLARAVALIAAGQPAEAARILDPLVDEAPLDLDCRIYRFIARLMAGHPGEALDDWLPATRLAGATPGPGFRMAMRIREWWDLEERERQKRAREHR